MRFGTCLLALAMLAGAALAADPPSGLTNLPPGGTDIEFKGITLHTPGEGWTMNARPESDWFTVEFVEGKPAAGSSATITVTIDEQMDVADVFTAPRLRSEIDKMVEEQKSRLQNVAASVDTRTVKGAHCIDQKIAGSLKGAVKLTTIRACQHPDDATLTVVVKFEATVPVGAPSPESIANAVADSLAFVPKPWRKRLLELDGSLAVFAQGDGALWVGLRQDDSSNTLVERIDPASNTVTAQIPLEGYVEAMGVAPGSLWVGLEGGDLLRIDTATSDVKQRLELGKTPLQIASAGGYLFVLQGAYNGDLYLPAGVVRIDTATGAVQPVADADVEALFVSAGGLYLFSRGTQSTLIHLDPVNLQVLERIGLDSMPFVSGSDIWLYDNEAGTVRKLASSERIAVPKLETPFSFAVWDGVPCVLKDKSLKCTNGFELQLKGNGNRVLEATGRSLWILGDGDNVVLRLDAK